MFPTVCVRDSKDCGRNVNYRAITHKLAGAVGGELNPDWIEWFMGWPAGWTVLQSLAMGRFQQWLSRHGAS
jgi:hypothetical protein